MAKHSSKSDTRQRIHIRIRKKVSGTQGRPRLCIYRSLNHIYAQIVDDEKAMTLVSASTLDKEIREKTKAGGNIAGAKVVGQEIARRAKAKGIETVVYDRGGYRYHGRVKVLAEAAREAGLTF